MRPKILKISTGPELSFSCRYEKVPFFYSEWHCHPEIELVYIESGTGTQFIGNNIHHFNEGNMVMVGSGLPHLWKCDEAYFEKGSTLSAASYVVHFLPDVFGNDFFRLPENRATIELFEHAKLGIQIIGDTKMKVLELMCQLIPAKAIDRTILLLQILQAIIQSNEWHLITKVNQIQPYSVKESERMNSIYQYVIEHFTREISLDVIAKEAHLTPNAFCRFFKGRTKKTFTRFLLEMRINHSCKLLAESDKNIEEVLNLSGFNSSSHYNRYFKQLMGVTPYEYRKQQQLKNS